VALRPLKSVVTKRVQSRRHPPFTAAENNELRSRWLRGERLKSIAAQMERPVGSLRARRRKLRLSPRPNGYRPEMTDQLHITLQPTLRAVAERRAWGLGLSLSQYVRRLIATDCGR
jgi:hypothetical protein